MVVEVLLPIRSIWDHKGVIGDLLDYSIVNEIADQDGSTPVDLGLLLGLGQLVLKLIKARQLGADCVLLLQLCLLLFLDLLLGPSPLGADLQHVDADAVQTI